MGPTCSTAPSFTGVGNICNLALPSGSGGVDMREAYEDRLFGELEAFRPDFVLISAGFDADYRDPLGGLNWRPGDFAWLTRRLMDIADRCCEGRIVSVLEGGYDRQGLAQGAAAHVSALMGIGELVG